MRAPPALTCFGILSMLTGCTATGRYDVLIRNGTLYDGSGGPPRRADLGMRGDRIAAIGDLRRATARQEIDASGRAVAPGFINMLSWATESLIHDGRSQSDIRQGVTLEVMGEGHSMGPLNDAMKQEILARQEDIKYPVNWTTLDEYLSYLETRGVSCNVASFVGATTVREHVLGKNDVDPTPEQLARMCELVRQAMRDGAMGVASALIYTPAAFADTPELIALARAAAEYDGMYISHIRNEADGLFEALDELITIAREASVRAELYHIKASGRSNWGKLDEMIRRIEAARAEGLHVTADMYTYHASSTGLDAVMPPWVQEGGHDSWVQRLKDPAIRERVRAEMNAPTRAWDNGWLSAGSPDNILLVGFKTDKLKPYTGKTLAEVAAERGRAPEDVAMDLVIEDDSRIGCVFFSMSEDNVRREIKLPWVSICSDAGSLAPEGLFLAQSTHPRAYGSFARLLGKFVRDERLISLEEAIHRMTTLPAKNLKLDRRGALAEGHYADVVVFDPAAIRDNATFNAPHQYATGVAHVFVNGVHVLEDGQHTGATSGRVVRGPGWRRGSAR